MKKLILVILALALLGVAAFLFLLHRSQSAGPTGPDAAGFVPANAVAFVQLSDAARSRERWTKTGLHNILHEPEVEAFLEKAKGHLPIDSSLMNDFHAFLETHPAQAFGAVTDLSGEIPKFVAGFSYTGKKEEVAAVIQKAKTAALTQWPAGKSDLVQYGAEEIETFTDNGVMVASCFRKDWYFIANDLDLLKATLDRAAGKENPASPSLRDSAPMKSALSHMPEGWDLLILAQPQALVGRLESLATATGQHVEESQWDSIRQISAIAATTRMEGEDLRDTLLVLSSGTAPQQKLSHGSLALTSTDTVFYYATAINLPAKIEMPDASNDITGLLQMVAGMNQQLGLQGVSLNDLATTFGPEAGVLLDWPASSTQPSLLFSIDVRNTANAKGFLDAVTSAGTSPWAKQDVDGAHYYMKSAEGFSIFAPTLALTDHAILAGLSFETVRSAAGHLKNGGATLEQSGSFSQTLSRVVQPEYSVGYIDDRGLWERFYALARPTLILSAPLIPHATDYVDFNKLPATETIARHLKPTVLSQAAIPGGTISESVGTVTFSQALLGTGLAATAAVVSNLQTLQSFGVIPQNPFGGAAAPAPGPGGSPSFAPGVPMTPPVPAPAPGMTGTAATSGTTP